MEYETVKINLRWASYLSMAILVLALALGLLLQILLFSDRFFGIKLWEIAVVLVGLIVCTVAHELIHGLCFMLFGAKFKDLKFGIIPKMLSAFCSCRKPLKIYQYIIVLIAPTIIVGIIPYILSIIFLSPLYVCMFATMISGGAGDILMLIKASKYDKNQLVLDSPTEPAFTIIKNQNF